MTTTNVPSARSPLAEPTTLVSGGWIALFATAWLGIWMAQLVPIQLLLPQQVDAQLGADAFWVDKVVAFGIISAIAGACALVAYPLTGALSDRTVSRLGRRRPWILAGALVFSGSLVLLGLQSTIVGIGVFWALALTGFCMVTAAITAMISDQVPVNQRGFVSAWVSAPQAVGTVLGLVLVLYLITGQLLGYVAMAVLLLLLLLPFLLRMPDEVLTAELRPKALTVGTFLQGLWISPPKYPDFGWTLLSRILVNIGNALGTAMLLFFLMFGLEREAPEDDLLLITLIYLAFFVLAALGAGRFSDMIGKRKPFVYIAAYLQALAALLLALLPDFTIALGAAALLGMGYGCFMAVDQALATQVLPDQATRGKDLGIMNIATAVPQAVAPLLGAIIVYSSAGFGGLFLTSAIATTLGALALIPIRSVR